MPPDPTGYAGPHPDLRALYCDALHQLREQMEASGQQAHAPPIPVDLQPDDVVVRCQRTWRNIQSRSPVRNGGDHSASVVQFTANGDHYSFFIEASRPAGESEWQWAGTSGGKRPSKRTDQSGGFSITGGEYVWVGGLPGSRGRLSRLRQMRPFRWLFPIRSWESIQVEHADGSTYSATVEDDGCAIVFAPVTSEPSPADEVIVRHLGARGEVIAEARTWIGDGGPPPFDMFQRLAER